MEIFTLLFLASITWASVVCLFKGASRLAARNRVAHVDMEWWRVDIYLPNSNFAWLSSALVWKKTIRYWFGIGVVSALLLGAYACQLLVFELWRLTQRLLQQPVGSAVHSPQLQLAVPGLTLPASHILYLWTGTLLSMAIHEGGHALAAAAEQVRVEGLGLSLIVFFPVAYVALDDAGVASLSGSQLLRVACAGAWHNAVLSLLCWAAIAAWHAAGGVAGVQSGVLLLLNYTASISAALGMLNMAPVHWLDGEKAFRALLCGGLATPVLPLAVDRRRFKEAWREVFTNWLLHSGTAIMAAVVLLHAVCLRWCS